MAGSRVRNPLVDVCESQLTAPAGPGQLHRIGERSITLARSKLATQRVGQRFGDLDIDEVADQFGGVGGTEIDDSVVLGAPGELAGVLGREPGDQDALGRAHHTAADLRRLLQDALLQNGPLKLPEQDRHPMRWR